MGRAFSNNLINLGLYETYKAAFWEMGIDFDAITDEENDAGLGNGGLGRLAACFLDSLSTMELPAVGCGIRYEYGMFRQKIVDGTQIEMEDDWLRDGNIWEIERPELSVEVHFNGTIPVSYTHLGELTRVSQVIAEAQGNIVELEHNQFVSINRNNAVELTITMEAFGTEHKNKIIKALKKAGYDPKIRNSKSVY